MNSYVNSNRWVIFALLVFFGFAATSCNTSTNNQEVSAELQQQLDSLETANGNMNSLLEQQQQNIDELNNNLAAKDSQIGNLRYTVNAKNRQLRANAKDSLVRFYLTRYDTLNIPENFMDNKSVEKVTLPRSTAMMAADDLLFSDSIRIEYSYVSDKLTLTESKVTAQDSVISLQNQKITNYVEVVNTQNKEIANVNELNRSQKNQINTLNKKLTRTRVLGGIGTLLGFGTAAVR